MIDDMLTINNLGDIIYLKRYSVIKYISLNKLV